MTENQSPEEWDSQKEFCRIAHKAGVPSGKSEEIYFDLVSRYAEPHRAYHNLDHIQQMLGLFNESEDRGDLAIELAIWFHDVIYDPLSAKNEEESALFFHERFDGDISRKLLERVNRLILATRHIASDTIEQDEMFLCDIDLSVLSAGPKDYETYRLAIREEYIMIPEKDFVRGRIEVLEKFLSRPIYRTRAFSSRESRARENLLCELKLLKLLGLK